MHNDTWYPLMVNETVVNSAYSGQVWDVVRVIGTSQNTNSENNFTLQAEVNGTWQTVEPVVIQDQGVSYSYYVVDSWSTSAVTHSIELRYMYTGSEMEYRGDLVTLTSNGTVAGYQLWHPISYQGGLFNANVIA